MTIPGGFPREPGLESAARGRERKRLVPTSKVFLGWKGKFWLTLIFLNILFTEGRYISSSYLIEKYYRRIYIEEYIFYIEYRIYI